MKTLTPAAIRSAVLPAVLVASLVAWPGNGLALAQSATGSPKILVGLFRATAFTVSSAGALTLKASTAGAESPASPIAVPSNSEVTFSASGTAISWEVDAPGASPVKGQSAGPVLIGAPSQATQPGSPAGTPQLPGPPLAQPSTQAAPIAVKKQVGASASFTGASFRGSLLVIPPSGSPPGGLLAANVVDMEDYVQSVVGGEIPDGWPLECLKAQAIAARSYAGYRLRLTRDSPARDYEKDFRTVAAGGVLIWAGTSDQVYRGIGEESAQSVDATRATRGKMLTYGGAPIGAYFCSDAGGMTEDPRYVWGGSKPYLQAVREVPHDSPYSSWTVALDEASLAEGLGQLDIELAGVPDMIAGYEPGVSGRWTGVTVGSASGLQTVKSGDFRRVFPQVRSMLFSSFAVGGGEASRGQVGAEMEVFVQADGKVAPSVKIGASVLLGDDGRAARNCRGAVVVSGVTEQAPVTYIIQGRGWGHGVGLSQYGAKAMALSGQDAAAILKLYFPGTVLDQWWQ